jgi:Cu+-exporting ATPase
MSVIIAVLSALCFGLKFMSALSALEVLAFCLITLNSPTVLFCESLPLGSAGKRLNKQGGMLTGVKAALSIDLANAIIITSSQLFPSGTITLYDMKILDSNAVDSTLIDAAAITNAIDSPLKGIFNSIAKTTPVEMPIADTIKYEERLGISGWINDRRIFIGNRTLLEAHGITTPSIEVDKKILRQGFFPVYLASQGKPCALLIVKYNVKKDIAIKLQKLSGMGVTFLIDNCDPNLTNQMVADYFGIWEESVRIMGSSGSQLNRNATEPEPYFSSPCCHGGSFTQLADVFITASKVKKSTKILSVFHVVASVIIAL